MVSFSTGFPAKSDARRDGVLPGLLDSAHFVLHLQRSRMERHEAGEYL
jgi:hypothetical protein